MKSNIHFKLLSGALLGGMLLAPVAAHAQNNVTPATGGRLAVVDIKDASLKDALDLAFDSAGIKSRSIDASASQVFVPDVVRSNIAWDDLVRSLCLTYNYKFSRNRDGLYVIEPRVPIGLTNPDGSPGFPGQDGFPGQGSFPGQGGFPGQGQGGVPGRGVTSAPANPFGFGGAPQGNTRNFGNRQMLPAVTTRANSQTTPRVGGQAGGRAAAGGRNTTEPIKYTIIRVRHVYSGGISSLFSEGSTITTDIFVTPGSLNGGGQGGGQGGQSGGGGGFGGGIGGQGGGGGGFGGGGGGSSIGGGGGGFGGGGGGGGFGGGGF